MKRRRFDADTKVVIVFEGLRSETTIADLCRKYQISEAMYYRWRDRFLKGGKNAFLNNNSNKKKFYKDKISELERIIDKQIDHYEVGIQLYEKDYKMSDK